MGRKSRVRSQLGTCSACPAGSPCSCPHSSLSGQSGRQQSLLPPWAGSSLVPVLERRYSDTCTTPTLRLQAQNRRTSEPGFLFYCVCVYVRASVKMNYGKQVVSSIRIIYYTFHVQQNPRSMVNHSWLVIVQPARYIKKTVFFSGEKCAGAKMNILPQTMQ